MTVSQPHPSSSASANAYSEPKLRKDAEEIPCHIIKRDNHTSILSVNFLTFVSYLLLSHERSGLAIDILCPFEGSLPFATVVLNGEQRMTIVFTRELVAGLIGYAGSLGRAGLEVPHGEFPVKMA